MAKLTKEEFWDALTLPVERGCFNCIHDHKIISCILPAAFVCKRNMWADDDDKDHWKWDRENH